MAVIQERPGSGTSPSSENGLDAPKSGPAGFTVRGRLPVSGLIGLSILQIEWALVLGRALWIALAVGMVTLSSGMESVRVVWLIAGSIVAVYGVAVAVVLRKGAVREAAVLGIALDAALTTGVLSAVFYLASRNDPANIFIIAQLAFAVITLVVAISVLRLRLLPAIVIGVFLTVVPAGIAALIADGGVSDGELGRGVLRVAIAALLFGTLGQVFQRTRSEMVRQVDEIRRLHGESERRAGDRALIAELGRIVSQSPDVRETYERFAEVVRSVLPADRVSVNIYDSEHDVLVTTYISGQEIGGWEQHALHSLDETPLALVIRERRGVLVGQGENELNLTGSYLAGAREGLISAMAVPLLHQGDVIGTLGLRSRDPDAYDEVSLSLLERIGTQIAPAVANAALYSALERDATERAVFAEISRILSASPDIADVYEEFVEQARRLVQWDRISINTVDPGTGRLRTAYVAGYEIPAYPTGARRPPGNRSILEQVASTGRALLVADIKEMHDRFPDSNLALAAGIRSGIYVPLVADGVVVGTLAAGLGEPDAYSDADLRVLERMAVQIAGTIANSELRAQTDRQAREEAALAEIGRIISSSLRIDDVYDRFVDQVRALMPADRVSVIEVDSALGDLSIRYVNGLTIPSAEVGDTEQMLPNGLMEAVVRSGQGLAISDLGKRIDEFPAARRIFDSGIRSLLYSPLRSEGAVIGILCVASTEAGAHSEDHFELLERISAQIAGALANARLHERADRQAGEESALAEIGRIVNSSLDIDSVYEQFAEQVGRVLSFDRLAITRLGPNEDEFTISHFTGLEIPGLEVGAIWKLADTPLTPVLRDGETLLFHGAAAFELAASFPIVAVSVTAGIGSTMVVPLIERDRPVGFFSVRSMSDNAYTEADAVLARRVAALVSSAITNAELLERSDRLAREESALGEIGQIVNSSLDIETVYEQFAEQVQNILPFDRLAIAIRDQDGVHFTVSHVTGEVVPGLEAGAVSKISDANVQPVLERGETLLLQGGRDHDQISQVPDVMGELNSTLIVPLISRDRPIGFLALRINQETAYTEVHAVLARRVAVLASTAISNSLLYERAETEARERAVLAEIGRIVGSSLDINSVYARFAEQVRELIDFDRISIAYVDPRRSSAVYAWAEGEALTGFGIGREIPIKAFIGTRLGKLIRNRRGVVLDEAEIAEFLGGLPWASESSARSMVVVPLVSDDRTIAGLTLISSKPGVYGIRELEIATRVGSQVAGAVANARLHSALSEASEELKDINTQKTEVMTTVAHELKGPLTALRTFIDLVIEGTAGDVPVKQLELLLKASRSTTRMQNLLNVFSHLEMAEDHNIPLTVTMFDIGTLVTAALDLLQPVAAQAGVEVKITGFDDLPLIEGDRHAIEQVISNLVSNAIKYSYEGGVVTVSCEARAEDIIISVKDSGIGISAEDQERLFERFYRGTDPAKLRIRGTGLGLYVSRGLVERHHGRVWVQSEAGRGSAFSFTLPLEQPAEEPVGRDAPAA